MLNIEPNIADPDDFYEALIETHRGLSPEQSALLNAKLILVSGSPFALMKARQRRFFFDQSGTLTRKFAVRAVPAIVEQTGRVLRVSEIGLPPTKGQAR